MMNGRNLTQESRCDGGAEIGPRLTPAQFARVVAPDVTPDTNDSTIEVKLRGVRRGERRDGGVTTKRNTNKTI